MLSPHPVNLHGHLGTSVTAYPPQAGNLKGQDGGFTVAVREEHLPLAALSSHSRCDATATATERVDAGWKSTRVRPRRVNSWQSTTVRTWLSHMRWCRTAAQCTQSHMAPGQPVVNQWWSASRRQSSASQWHQAVSQWSTSGRPVATSGQPDGARTAGRCSFSSDTRTQTVTSPAPATAAATTPATGHGSSARLHLRHHQSQRRHSHRRHSSRRHGHGTRAHPSQMA